VRVGLVGPLPPPNGGMAMQTLQLARLLVMEGLAVSARLVKPSIERAARLLVPSKFLQQVFREVGLSSAIIPNIIDLETFHPAAEPPAATPFTVVITRNLEPIYGLDTAIRAIALAREALACGHPVISTNVGCVPYIVRDGLIAVLVDPGNEQQMADAIVELRRDSQLRHRLRNAGVETVAQYAWDEVRPQWLALYRACGAAV